MRLQSSKLQAVHLLTYLSGRHGDIEDTLLTLMLSRAAGGKKFDKMNVARVYFGNWLRDYCECLRGPGGGAEGGGYNSIVSGSISRIAS